MNNGSGQTQDSNTECFNNVQVQVGTQGIAFRKGPADNVVRKGPTDKIEVCTVFLPDPGTSDCADI
jgi:hypothetical protein